jgi:hypothetical protein
MCFMALLDFSVGRLLPQMAEPLARVTSQVCEEGVFMDSEAMFVLRCVEGAGASTGSLCVTGWFDENMNK